MTFRWAGGAAALLLTGLTLSGCSAADHTAVRLGDAGVPVVLNCGTWIERIRVTDADTGRQVWAAHAVAEPDGDVAGVADLTVGSLPGRSWVQDASPALRPRPSRWRFTVTSVDEIVIVVPDAEFEPGRVYRPGGKSESATRFHDQTCSGMPMSAGAFRIVCATAVLVVGAIVVRARRQSRRRLARPAQ